MADAEAAAGVPFPAWWNGVRVEATAVPHRDHVLINIAPGQTLEVGMGWWRRMTIRVLIGWATLSRRV